MNTTLKAPFLHSNLSSYMYPMLGLFSLIPAVGWGIFRYGFLAVTVIAVSILGAWLGKLVLDHVILKRKSSIWTALFIGALIGSLFPADIFVLLPFLASFIGITLGYGLFGTSRMTVVSPVLVGYLLVYISTPGLFAQGGFVSPLDSWYQSLRLDPTVVGRPIDMLGSLGVGDLQGAEQVQSLLRQIFGIQVPTQVFTLLLGFANGSVGGSSPVLLLIGSVFMFAKRVGDWRLSAGLVLTFSLFSIVFGGLFYQSSVIHGDALFFVLDGNFLLAVLFIPQVLGTKPVTAKGRFVFGLLSGFILAIFVHLGFRSQSILVGLALSQMFVPLVDVFTRSKSSYLRKLARI